MDLVTLENNEAQKTLERVLQGRALTVTMLTENGSTVGVDIESSRGLVRLAYTNYSFKVMTTPPPVLIPCLIAYVYYDGKLLAESDLIGKTEGMYDSTFDDLVARCVETLMEPYGTPFDFDANKFASESRRWFEDNPEEISRTLEQGKWALVIRYEQVDAKDYALTQELNPTKKKSRF